MTKKLLSIICCTLLSFSSISAMPVMADETNQPVVTTTNEYYGQVSNFKATSTANGVTLTWNAAEEAEGYIIGSIHNGSPYAQLGFVVGANQTTFTDTTASLTNYSYYWVFPYKKINGKVTRGKASGNYTYGIKYLPAPANLSAVTSSGSVNLNWNAVSGANGYIIKCRRGNESIFVLGDTASTSFTDTQAPTNTFSYYWVYAYTNAGTSKRPGLTSNYAYAKADPAIYSAGAYKIGSTMPSGEYILYTNDPDGYLYFSVCSDSNGNDIIFNDFTKNNQIITVYDGEYLTLTRCYAVPFTGYEPVDTTQTTFFAKVGVHLAAGEYLLTATDSRGYYCIYDDSRQQNIIANNFFEGTAYMTVSDGQYVSIHNCTLSR